MTWKTLSRVVLAAGMTTALAAGGCDGGSNTGGFVVPIQDQFGAGFANAFNAADTDEPVEPVAGDIIALDATEDPIDF